MDIRKLVLAMLGSTCLVSPVAAQTAPAAEGEEPPAEMIVTGSRIKRSIQDSPLPLQVFTHQIPLFAIERVEALKDGASAL